MKLSATCLALVLSLSACVSDDADAAGVVVTNADGGSQNKAAPAQSSTTRKAPPTSRVQASDDGDVDGETGSDQISGPGVMAESGPAARRQGGPITVTTAGPQVLANSVARSSTHITREWCEVSESGALLALAEVQNTGGLEGDFILEFEVLNPLGVRVAEGLDVVHDVKAGQSFISREALIDVVGFTGDARSWTCQVLTLSTPEAVLQ